MAADYPLEFTIYSRPRPPQSLSQIERVRPTLAALAGFLGVIGVVGLLHFLLLSGSRRRHETGVLKAIGFVRRQTGEIVARQAVTIAVLGVVVGVPLGVIGGRAVWLAAVGDSGIIDTPTMPWAIGAVLVGGAVIGAIGVALVPAWLTSRASPAEALRSEWGSGPDGLWLVLRPGLRDRAPWQLAGRWRCCLQRIGIRIRPVGRREGAIPATRREKIVRTS